MTHPRLTPIPGCEDTHLANVAKRQADMQMAVEGLQSLPFQAALHVVEQHFEARPDIDGIDLEQFTDRLRKLAWARQREQAQ